MYNWGRIKTFVELLMNSSWLLCYNFDTKVKLYINYFENVVMIILTDIL